MLHTLMAVLPRGAACGAVRHCRSLSAGIEDGVQTHVAVKRLLFVSGGSLGQGILLIRSQFLLAVVVAALSLTSRGAVILVVGVPLRAGLRFIAEIVRATASLMWLAISVHCDVWRLVSHLGRVVRIAARK